MVKSTLLVELFAIRVLSIAFTGQNVVFCYFFKVFAQYISYVQPTNVREEGNRNTLVRHPRYFLTQILMSIGAKSSKELQQIKLVFYLSALLHIKG